jgi:hypothetical protein
MGHDQLFKEILRTFLREFLELFFPDAAARLDFDSLRFPNKELFKGFPDGRPREPDLVAEVQGRDGKPEIVLVHVEVQAETEVAFGRRMFEYYALLWLEFDAPIFPIVLYLKGGGRKGIDIAEYRQELFGQEWVRFRYASVGLARLRAREYVETSPLGAALAALMRRGKASEELELRARMLKQVVSARFDEGRQFLLVNLIETYFELPAEERERFRRLVARKEYRDVQDVELTWGDRLRKEGLEQGLEEGIEKGVVQGKRETLKRLLTARFGPLPEQVRGRVDALSSTEELDPYLDRVLTAATLEDIGLGD